MSIDNSKEDDLLMSQDIEVDMIHLQSQPSCIQGTMRDYQIAALNWLLNQHQLGLNSILADEMGTSSSLPSHPGLGKTLETISLLGFLKQYMHNKCSFPPRLIDRGPHLILVPKSTLGNWMNEMARFCPSLKCFRFYGDKEERVALVKQLRSEKRREWNVLITTYETAVIEKGALGRIPWRCVRVQWFMSSYVIVDEAHRVKNENGKLASVLRQFSVENRLLLTGTPLQVRLASLRDA